MRKSMLLFVLAATLFSAVPLFALRTNGSPVILPVIGRFPGTGGTQWRTDVFIHNPYTPGQVVTLKYYPTGAAMMQTTITIQQYSGATLNDIILNTFGLTTSAGVLEVFGEDVMARARIYNTGNPAGQFAQGVPGIAKLRLGRQALLHGITGIGGSRVNVGVANPNDVPIEVGFRVASVSNTTLYSQTITVPAHSYVQFSDIFNAYGIPPQENVNVQFNTFELPLYGYSSEVRNDTGDAVFSFGTSPNA